MDSVVSKDGTSIAFQKSGSGSPLVLVHGTAADYTRWQSILLLLEAKYTVYAINRRGRSHSIDSGQYQIEREFEDIASVVDSIAGKTSLLGHSYGGICCLEAALLTQKLHSLILYEPPISSANALNYPERTISKIDQLVEGGDSDGAVQFFLKEIAKMSPNEISLLRSAPSWKGRVGSAHTISRELRAEEAYKFNADRFRMLPAPVLLLLGEESPEFFKHSIQLLEQTLPNSRTVILPGQAHVAMSTTPEMFAREIMTFLDKT
jgi:pimeloyl-ACP methyl ester carboxylesterase